MISIFDSNARCMKFIFAKVLTSAGTLALNKMITYTVMIVLISPQAKADTNHISVDLRSYYDSVDYENYKQSTAWTCGPAALRLFLSSHGVIASENEIAEKARSKKDYGTSLLNLKTTSLSYGINVDGYLWKWDNIKKARFPFIAHLNDYHYILVLSFDAEHLEVFDPTKGHFWKTRAAFLDQWSGIVLAYVDNNENSKGHKGSKGRLSLAEAIKSATMHSIDASKNSNTHEWLSRAAEQKYTAYKPYSELKIESDRRVDESMGGAYAPGHGQSLRSSYQVRLKRLSSRRMGGEFNFSAAIGLGVIEDKNQVSPTLYDVTPEIALTYTQPLSRHGREAIYSGFDMIGLEKLIADLDYSDQNDKLIMEVIDSYYYLLKQIKQLEISRESNNRSEMQLENARKQLSAGDIAEIEVLKLNVQVSRDSNDVINQEKILENAKDRFRLLIGLRPGEEFLLDDYIEHQEPTINKDGLLELALKTRVEIKKIEYQIRHAELERTVIKSETYPTMEVGLHSTWKKNSEKASDLFDERTSNVWRFNVSLTVPLSDSGISKMKNSSMNARINSLYDQKRLEEERIKNNIALSVRDINESNSRYKALGEALGLASENLKVDELRFNKGLISSDDLLRTQLNYYQINIDRYGALADYKRTELILKYYLGILDINSL